MEQDVRFMKKALELARRAYAINEVPVGCVIVREGKIIARGYNLRENRQQATAHAEIVAIEKACRRVGYWRLNGCTRSGPLEPCPMCAGAIINARIDRVVFGAYDEKRGCCGSIYELTSDRRFNHLPAVTGGVLAEECAQLMTDYFKLKREENRRRKAAGTEEELSD